MTKKHKGGILLITVIGIALLVIYSQYSEYFTFSQLKAHKEWLKSIAVEHPYAAPTFFFLLYLWLTVFSIPIATIVILSIGFVYGRLWGTVLVSFASTFGACITFLISRYYLSHFAQKYFSKRLEQVKKGFAQKGEMYLLSLRLFPFFPYILINLLFGLTNMKLKRFYIVSQIGMLPYTFFYINAGYELGKINNISDIFTWQLWVSLLALAIVPLVLVRLKKSHRQDSI